MNTQPVLDPMKAIAALLAAVLLLSARFAQAEPLYTPNADFGLPLVTNLDTDVATNMVVWATSPPDAEGGIGVFGNLPGDGEYITNCIGHQAAYLFNEGGLAMFQDFDSVDSEGASNVFLSTFDVGRTYKLTAGLIASIDFGDAPGSSLAMSVYYRDKKFMVTIASTNIVYDTNVFTTITGFVPFELDVPPVQPDDAWAGKHIGIRFLCTTFETNLEGGFWDVGNVALSSSIHVPNADFALPLVTDFATDVNTNMVSWETFPPQTSGAIGVFGNLPGDGEYITNCVGGQAAYLFNDGGLAFFQDYTATDSTGAQDTNFTATYEAGKSYTLSAGLIGSTNFGMAPGSSIEMSLYYLDGSNNMVTVAATNIVYDTNVFTSIFGFVTCQLASPTVNPTDPWAGQHIGIEFQSATFDTNLEGGFWDVGNIALSESLTPILVNPAVANGQFQVTLKSDPGLSFQILAARNLTSPAWATVTSLTNVTGMDSFVDSLTNGPQRFYKAQQSPLP
jgi:hypothetical protein